MPELQGSIGNLLTLKGTQPGMLVHVGEKQEEASHQNNGLKNTIVATDVAI